MTAYREKVTAALREDDYEQLTTLAIEMALICDKPVIRRAAANKLPYSTIEEQAWAAYPSRGIHSNPKREAIEKFRATLRRGAIPFDVLNGTRRYAAYCTQKGIIGTDRVMQARRLWGREEEWKLPWTESTPEKGAGVPTRHHHSAEDRKWATQKAQWAVDRRRGQLDGDRWWETIMEEGKAKGLSTYGQLLFYAAEKAEA